LKPLEIAEMMGTKYLQDQYLSKQSLRFPPEMIDLGTTPPGPIDQKMVKQDKKEEKEEKEMMTEEEKKKKDKIVYYSKDLKGGQGEWNVWKLLTSKPPSSKHALLHSYDERYFQARNLEIIRKGIEKLQKLS